MRQTLASLMVSNPLYTFQLTNQLKQYLTKPSVTYWLSHPHEDNIADPPAEFLLDGHDLRRGGGGRLF